MMRLRLLLFLAVLLMAVSAVIAQDSSGENVCLADEAVEAAAAACESTAPGQICLGTGAVSVDTLASAGDTVDIGNVETLTGESGSVTLMRLGAGRAEEAEAVTLVLYGGATITNTFEPLESPYPSLSISNNGQYDLNLRRGPSTNEVVVGLMERGATLTADGISADGQWLHVLLEDGEEAWVSLPLITVDDGDVTELYTLGSLIKSHMQSFTLESPAEDDCSSGLLVYATGDEVAHLEVNGALLAFDEATLVLNSSGDALELRVVGGSVDVTAEGRKVTADEGEQVVIALDGLQVASTPEVQDRFGFAVLDSAPLAILPEESLVCAVGVSEDVATLYRGPGSDYAVVSEIEPESYRMVTGQATTDDGMNWWRVSNGWVDQEVVETAGLCRAVETVEPVAFTAASSIAETAASYTHTFLPGGQSVWQARPSADNLSGTCSTAPIATCDHLAAITNNGNGTISWRGQEPTPYTLYAVGPDQFAMRGRSGLGNATMTLYVEMTSETTWGGSMTIVYDSDPTCTHTIYYGATKIR